jgi:hypothetical protein
VCADLLLGATTTGAESCAQAARGDEQAQISARAQPAPSHLRIAAPRFCICSKGSPQALERAPVHWSRMNLPQKTKRPN